VSYAGRVVEYGVLVDDRPLVVTFGVEPTAPLPLATRVFDGVDGAPLVALLADDRVLDVHVGDDALPIRVADYLTTLATPGPAVALGAIPTELRPLLDAVLPARAEIAPVPAFWRNLDQPPPPAATSARRRRPGARSCRTGRRRCRSWARCSSRARACATIATAARA
jgi:hypothetical protein